MSVYYTVYAYDVDDDEDGSDLIFWEVVDSDGVIIADEFLTEADADEFAEHLNKNQIALGEGGAF